MGYEKEQGRVDTLRRKKPKSKISESGSLSQRDIEIENSDTKVIDDETEKNIIKCNELTMGRESTEIKNKMIEENRKFEQENNAADIRETRRLEQQKSIDEIGDFRNIKYEKEQERVDTLRKKKPKSKISESEYLLQRDIESENI